MKLNRIILLSLLQMGFSVSSHADLYEPVPHCYEPSKLLWFASSAYKERYENDVNGYHTCMKEFILKQENSAKRHAKAAQDAIKTWNEFVKNK